MGSRNRNSSEQRDNFLLETNFDDDGALTRAHFDNNRISNNGGMTETRPRAYRSNYSIDRYSDAAKSYREGQSSVILSEQMHQNIQCLLIKSTNSLKMAKAILEIIVVANLCVTQSQRLLTPTLISFSCFMLF